uniref:CBM2 domain-containing protein n=1 Tax=Streptomyces sp. NBC_00049 TaxID=2903617 RepID=A0AAU2JSJ3_9ACTN
MRTGSRTAALLALCCTAAAGLTGCGGPARDGYVAVGAAAPGPERGAGENVAPQGSVEFQQLGGPSAAGGSSVSSSTSTGDAGSPPTGGSAPGGATTTAPGGSANAPGTPPGPGSTTTAPGTPNTPGTGPGPSKPTGPTGPTSPSGPSPKPGTTTPPPATAAKLTLSAPARAAAADRWCERVTVTFTNTGGTPARSGTVSFATHIIGALGIDWATITTAQTLPAPIAGGTAKTQTYTVCVEAWRVPLGMRVETRKVTATWS